MASLIKPGSVKVVTKDGEVQVSLTIDLNLNLNAGGGLSTDNGEILINEMSKSSNTQSKKEDKFEWAIPDFEDAPKISFGKKEV